MRKMRAVLGVDAAWTFIRPSGVAVVREKPNGWALVEVASSYQEFCARADHQLGNALSIAPSDLLSAGSKLCGQAIDLVAIDMPLSRCRIVGRRPADNKVSSAYGAKKCGTHSPNATRPGPLSEALRDGFAQAGFPLLTEKTAPPGLIEVYPHPALVELTEASERLPYKASRVRTYWPNATSIERRGNLYRQWAAILALLERQIEGVTKALPPLAVDVTGSQLKAYEDQLDAVVCAWVAVCCLEGRAIAYGDANSAIWIPSASSPTLNS